MDAPHVYDIRAREIWRRLSAVTDPEMDEPITEMGFLDRLDVSPAGEVEIEFRLPSSWDSPGFAYLMAEGVRRAASEPIWVSRVRVALMNHGFAGRVNAAVEGERAPEAVFAELSGRDDLAELRQVQREKAFLRRQESVIRGLIAMGWSFERIAGLTLRGFDALDLSDQPEAALQKPRYRELLRAEDLACAPQDPAFVVWSGERLTAEGLGAICASCEGQARSAEAPERINIAPGRVAPRSIHISAVSRG